MSTSPPVTVESYEATVSCGAPSRKSARAASERRRACCAAAVSASRCLVSASEETFSVTDRPVTGSYSVSVLVGTFSAASSSPRVAEACWTTVSSSARAYAPEPARGGISSASRSTSTWRAAMAREYASCAWSAVLLPVRADWRTDGTEARASRSAAETSVPAVSSPACRSTRALPWAEGALDFTRPAAT